MNSSIAPGRASCNLAPSTLVSCSTEKAEADFFILLAPGTKSAKVEAVKFISGSPDLRPFAENLRTIDFGPVFPDAAPSKIVRRGTLACTTAGACTFTLALPESVRSLN